MIKKSEHELSQPYVSGNGELRQLAEELSGGFEDKRLVPRSGGMGVDEAMGLNIIKSDIQDKKEIDLESKETERLILQKIGTLKFDIEELERRGKKGDEVLAKRKEDEIKKLELMIKDLYKPAEPIVEPVYEKKEPALTEIIKDTLVVDEQGDQVNEKADEISLEDAEKIEKTKLSRAGSEITLALIENYEDLNALTEAEGDEKFKEKTREFWKNFAVHGFLKKDEKTGKFDVRTYTDLDGKCSLELLKMAGFDKEALGKKVKYVAQGESKDGYINIDTGKKHGIVIDGKTFYIDHHAPDSPWGTSATDFAYRMLVDMGLLEKSEHLDKMVGFVNAIDNGDYPGIENYFKDSWRTIAGMQRFLGGEDLARFFQKNKNPDPTRRLTDFELRRYGLIVTNKEVDKCEKQEKVAKKSLERLKQMQEDGFIVPSDRYGKIAVSIENEDKKNLPGDYIAARAFGCDAYVSYNKEKNIFKISSKIPIAEKYSQGMPMRETQWFKNIKDDSELTVTLEEILNKMTDGKLHPEGKLKQYLDNPEAFLEEDVFERILGEETMGKIIEIMRTYKENTLERLKKDEDWGTYQESTQNDLFETAVKKSFIEILDMIIKGKNITEKIDKNEFFEYVLKKI